MENNTTLLSDKQIVKAKLNTAADSFLPPLLYTCSLPAACQTYTNKTNSQLFFTGLSVPSSFELRIIHLLVNLERCCSPLRCLLAVVPSFSLSQNPPPLAWLPSLPCSCPLLVSFVRLCLKAGLLCGGMRVLGVWSAQYCTNATTEKDEREEDIYWEPSQRNED